MTQHYTQSPRLNERGLRTALTTLMRDDLRSATLGLGVVMAALAVTHVFLLEGIIRNVMFVVAALAALGLFLIYARLRAGKITLAQVYPTALTASGLILINTFLHVYLDQNPLQTTNFILFIIGLSLLFLSTRWLLPVLLTAVGLWAIAAFNSPPNPAWIHFGFALAFSFALGIVVHRNRVRVMRQQVQFRLSDELRQQELEAMLQVTQGERRALETTIAVGQSVSSILNLDVLLNQVVELIKKQYGYYYVGIFLLDESSEHIVSRAGTGEAGRTLCQRGFSLKVGEEGLIGWVAHHRRPALVNNIAHDPRFIKVDAIPETQAELVLPLEATGTLLGVLDLQSTQTGVFGEQDIAVFQSLASQVAIAIQNASTYESERSRRVLAETLSEVGQALSQTLDLAEILELLLDYLHALVPFDRGSVMLRSNEDLEIVAARGFPPGTNFQTIRIAIDDDNDLFWQIYRTRKPLLIPDVSKWESWVYVEDLPRARSWLGVPLLHQEEVIGMLSLARETPDPYTPAEADLTTAFAGQTAAALENARLYANVTRAYAQLERLDRTKSDFINVAAHELRTPLTTLRGYSQILLKDATIEANPMHQQMVNGIYEGAVRLHEIVNTMLDMAKIDSRALQLHTQTVKLPTVLQHVHEIFKEALAERDITLTLDLPVLPSLEADSNELKKVFQQLVMNAIKYTPDGGSITITGRAVPAHEDRLPVDGVEIVVSDTGIGIDPDFQELIFTKFYQTGEVALHSSGKTKFKGGGPGLGLAIAKGITEAHGGQLWLESPGYDEVTCPGSAFHVVLPLHPPITT